MNEVDFSDFNPSDVGEFVSGIAKGIVDIASHWWSETKEDGEGYLAAVASAVIQTKVAHAAGRISDAGAKIYMRAHRRAIRSYFLRLEYRTLQLMQSILDLVADAFGWAIFNITGVSVSTKYQS
ncbi:hypothetical protein [uncultured Roseobacter sp.]|uniref:hypothetical protein n=1 Tax=uncultured Roseobacter sp. TaxID=114847 RepID=UPI0026026308|nr:hypothetical protein [uncultured Roseobacter sp.]